MSQEEFLAQMELEKLWREEEIRSLNNLIGRIDNVNEKNKIRRAIICLLYAHVEGFVKFSFGLYIDGVNQLELKCSEVKPVLAAAVFYKDFLVLTNPDAKSKIFKKTLPDDSHIHRIFRHEEFFEKIESFFKEIIKIEDGYVNTESNVGREVMEKLLYQVGLSHKSLESTIGPLSKLKNKRNNISHGIDKSIITDSEYEDYYSCSLGIMRDLSRILFHAFSHKEFLKELKAS